MKILVAPDSYKGSLMAEEVASVMEQAIMEVLPCAEVMKLPLADGGEGTAQAIVDATKGQIVHCDVIGPLGEVVTAKYGRFGDGETAIIEMAAASGWMLVPRERLNPMETTTYGTGQLIKAAMDAGCRKIIVGLGGSATNDGGVGMAQALGVRFLDEEGKEIRGGGGQLSKIHRIDMSGLDPRIAECELVAASDVTNPLCGPDGASYVFGPQKGATPEMARCLDEGLLHLGQCIRDQLGLDIVDMKGAGAAGGLSGGLVAFLGARMSRGIDIVLEAVRFEEMVKQVDLVITGEGCTDAQTAYGKTPVGVARLAKKYGKPVICISGAIIVEEVESLYDLGLDIIVGASQSPMTLDAAMANAPILLKNAVRSVVRAVGLLGSNIKAV